MSTSLAQYCSSGPTTTVDTTLYAISLRGDSTNLADPSPPCPGFAGVRLLTSQVADLTIGQTYQLAYNVSTCGAIFEVRSTAWIDYNANNVYDPSEALFPLSSVFGFQTYSFTVPATSLLGNTRIRVQVQETNTATISPCDSFSYGGTTDFSVSIRSAGPVYCEAGPTTGNDMNLGPVHLNGFTLSINDASDCPSVIGGADLTAQIADVNPGDNYVLNYQVTDCNAGSAAWPTLSGAWIDYNQDTIFDAWESLGMSAQNALASVSLPFTVPLSTSGQLVIPGNTRMRVQVQETNAELLDPCSHFAWGGTKDFTIRIWEPKNYCVSGPTQTTNTALGAVTLVGQTTSINDPANCSNVQTGVVDKTLMVADVVPAVPFTITWHVITCGTQFPTISAAWLDYNQNELYEAWEQITPKSTAFGIVSYGFKVPPSAPNQVVVGGPTRLRVQVQQGSGTLDPCALFTNGGTREYTVNIVTASEESNVNVTQYGGRNRYSRIEALKQL